MTPAALARKLVRRFRAERRARQKAAEEAARLERAEAGRAELLRTAQQSTGLLLDIGTSTAFVSPGWIPCDIDPDEQSLRIDAAKPWPLPDGCAKAVRAEHMIEHLSWEEAELCVGEMARVLEPGGLCRICTPDLEGISRAYLERDPRVLEAHREVGYFAPTWSQLPNNYLRMFGHRFVFDFESLRYLLERAGFDAVERTGFNRSRHALLDGTDSHDPGVLESLILCVDAEKPDSR